ncbi:MAG: tyrosine-type recombinase/integrase [Brevinematia bacterium]
MNELLDSFLDYLRLNKNYSSLTIQNYSRDINYFIEFIERNNIELEKITSKVIREFSFYLKSTRNLKSSSLRRVFSSIKSFSKFLYRNKIVSKNFGKYIVYPKLSEELPKFLDVDKMILLLKQLDSKINNCRNQKKKYTLIRDATIIFCFYLTGTRISELAQITLKDIDFHSNTITIKGKGNKKRIIPIHPLLNEKINDYLSIRDLIKTKNTNLLFVGKSKKGGISIRQIRNLVYKYTSMIGNRLNPHGIRHTFATHLLDDGNDIRIIQEILGHSSIATTQRYTHTSLKRIKNIYDKYHSHA